MVFLCTVFQGLKCRRENPYFRLWTCVFSVTQVAQGKEFDCQCSKLKSLGFEFDPWVRKIPWEGGHSNPPGEFHEQRSLAGYSPQGCKESDMNEVT